MGDHCHHSRACMFPEEVGERKAIPYTTINSAYGEAEVIMGRLRHASASSDFESVVAKEYTALEDAWKRCLEFEARCPNTAEEKINSLALVSTTHPSSTNAVATTAATTTTTTIHDVEDLHNEVKICLMELSEDAPQVGMA